MLVSLNTLLERNLENRNNNYMKVEDSQWPLTVSQQGVHVSCYCMTIHPGSYP